MKKLLAMYICVSAFLNGFDAKASGLDMPPLDNSHTQFSLVPESLFDNSSSYQVARTYFMPDYQRNLVGKQFGGRVNDGGKDAGDKACSTYGLLDSCATHRVGKGVQHPIAGLTCYEECVCDTSYYKYTATNCRSPKTLSEGCTDEKKVDIIGGDFIKDNGLTNLSGSRRQASLVGVGGIRTTQYAQCACPAEYNLPNCPTGMDCGLPCDGKYKSGTCKSGYTMTSGGTCEMMSCSSYGGYDICPAGYGVTENFSTPTGIHCVKCSQCAAGTYSKGTGACVACACGTYSARAGASSCTACASGAYQTLTGQTSCKKVAHAEGWTISADKCTISKNKCAAGFTAGVTTCSQGTYSSSGYSGDEVCGKCTLKGCPSGQIDTNTYWCSIPKTMDCSVLGYVKNSCDDNQYALKCPFGDNKYFCLNANVGISCPYKNVTFVKNNLLGSSESVTYASFKHTQVNSWKINEHDAAQNPNLLAFCSSGSGYSSIYSCPSSFVLRMYFSCIYDVDGKTVTVDHTITDFTVDKALISHGAITGFALDAACKKAIVTDTDTGCSELNSTHVIKSSDVTGGGILSPLSSLE